MAHFIMLGDSPSPKNTYSILFSQSITFDFVNDIRVIVDKNNACTMLNTCLLQIQWRSAEDRSGVPDG